MTEKSGSEQPEHHNRINKTLKRSKPTYYSIRLALFFVVSFSLSYHRIKKRYSLSLSRNLRINTVVIEYRYSSARLLTSSSEMHCDNDSSWIHSAMELTGYSGTVIVINTAELN